MLPCIGELHRCCTIYLLRSGNMKFNASLTPYYKSVSQYGRPYMQQRASMHRVSPFRKFRFDENETSSVRLQDLGLSGLSMLSDPKVSCSRKLFWSCLWLAALVCCVVECTRCVIAFASRPFTVDVTFSYNRTMTAPLVTLCPTDADFRNPAVSQVALKKLYCEGTYTSAEELLSKCKITIAQLWNISRFEMKEPSYRLFQTVKWLAGVDLKLDNIEKQELTTIHGVCMMFKMHMPLPCTGQQNGLDIEGHSLTPNETVADGYYTAVIHSEEEIPLIRYAGTTTRGFYAAYKQLTTSALRVQQIIHINTWKNPCQTNAHHTRCLIECIEKKIISKSKLKPCRLPYMDERLPLPPCETKDEFLNMYTVTQSAIEEAHPENCSCVKPCNKIHYREDYFLSYPVPHLMGFYLIIPQCDIEYIEDKLNYDFTSFLSDIGGDLGLFLGMSILSIFEILEVLFWKSLSVARLF